MINVDPFTGPIALTHTCQQIRHEFRPLFLKDIGFKGDFRWLATGSFESATRYLELWVVLKGGGWLHLGRDAGCLEVYEETGFGGKQ